MRETEKTEISTEERFMHLESELRNLAVLPFTYHTYNDTRGDDTDNEPLTSTEKMHLGDYFSDFRLKNLLVMLQKKPSPNGKPYTEFYLSQMSIFYEFGRWTRGYTYYRGESFTGLYPDEKMPEGKGSVVIYEFSNEY